ncbi:BTAD domain-containing putative transcriptional regulator [Streptosporangium amethystogenes subsp. fukuiense]|uniref:BTAD domain-containing putative transcriptional regulator n=2 Tax=Streptosporangium TaxID=2000 RepID=A0ABW2TAE5_9ACTN
MVAFRILGAFEVVGADGPVNLGAPRQRSVLGRLLVARGRVVPTARMIDDLWGDHPPGSAVASVHSYISNLRRVLESGRATGVPPRVLVTVSPGYAIRSEDVDAWRFEDMVRRGAAFLGAGDTRAALREFDMALGIWRGPAYAEFTTSDWALPEITRLDELHAMAVEHRANAAIALDSPGAVVADLRAHLAEHPLREEGWRLLAIALYNQGRQGDALVALRQARHTLVEELGIDPSPRLQQLEADILSQSSAIARPAAANESSERVTSSTAWFPPEKAGEAKGAAGPETGDQIFGRERELGLLSGMSRGIALISGEAGIGKSALVKAAMAGYSRLGWQVAVGRCPETGGAPAGWAWVEILRLLTAQVAPADRVAAQIRRLLADPDAPRSAHGDADLTSERFRLRRDLAVYFADAARVSPLLLVLDDLHRADEETLATLVDLASELRNTEVLIVGTFREEEADGLAETLAALARHEPVRIVLNGLDQDAAGSLLAAVSGTTVTPGTLAAVTGRTGGNPFFLRETARLIAAEGEDAALSTVPPGVRDVLRRRFARLPASMRGVLSEAAVIGRDFDIDVLIDLNGNGEEPVVEAVETALAAGLLAEPEGGGLRFTHALTRDALYDDMSRMRQIRTHGRVAASLERLRPRGVSALVHHFVAGGEPSAAARHCVLAAERAEQRFAYREAASFWGQAIELTDEKDPELLVGRVRALALCNKLDEARKLRKRAIQLALPHADHELTARVVGALDVPTAYRTEGGGEDSPEVVRVIEETLSQLPEGDRAARCSLLTSLAFELVGFEGDEAMRGAKAADEALAMARRLKDPEALAGALNARHLYTFRGDGDGAADRLRIGTELLRLAQAHGMVIVEILAHLILARQALECLDHPRAEHHTIRMEQLSAQHRLNGPGSLTTCRRAVWPAITVEHRTTGRLYRATARAHLLQDERWSEPISYHLPTGTER